MRWVKRGCIFDPRRQQSWFVSHAALPVVREMADHHRVYFSGRDSQSRARIGFLDLDLLRPERLLRVSLAPILGLGAFGAFDDSGVTSSCIVAHGDRVYHYYTGWSLGVTVPFYLGIGVAAGDPDDREVQRVSQAPVLGRTAADPYLTASPWIRIEEETWRMWYVSGSRWEMEQGRPKHYYHVRYASSRDGISWDAPGTVCIPYADQTEHAISRPCVVKDGGVYRMWYAHRGARYRIGYAESGDGLSWERRDGDAGIDVSQAGWDSEMQAYPCVFDFHGQCYMLYNGNGFGETGIGLAELDR